jgi:hypothetical protein
LQRFSPQALAQQTIAAYEKAAALHMARRPRREAMLAR